MGAHAHNYTRLQNGGEVSVNMAGKINLPNANMQDVKMFPAPRPVLLFSVCAVP